MSATRDEAAVEDLGSWQDLEDAGDVEDVKSLGSHLDRRMVVTAQTHTVPL